MLGKNTLKFIKSLSQKKFRKQESAFFVEGSKNVTELLHSDYIIRYLLYTEKFVSENPGILNGLQGKAYPVSQKVLESTGSFLTNDTALAVAETKPNIPFQIAEGELAIALDDIRDPGNLGTIVRIADWYGIQKILLSEESADFYNPKVIHASMGSFTRVKVFYTDLKSYLESTDSPVFGAFLDGENIHQRNLSPNGIILMGNESRGVSEDLEPWVTHKITIPGFGHAESLNVAIATAVICDNFMRKKSPVKTT